MKCPYCGMTIERIEDQFIVHIDPTSAPCEIEEGYTIEYWDDMPGWVLTNDVEAIEL